MAIAQPFPPPAQVATDRDLSGLEKALSCTSPIEHYVRYLLTLAWLYYWGVALVFAGLIAANVSDAIDLGVLRYAHSGGVFPTELDYLCDAIFFFAAAKAVIGYSKRWSAVALIVCGYRMLRMITAVPLLLRLYKTLPAAAAEFGAANIFHVLLYAAYIGCFWTIVRLSGDQVRLCGSAHRARFYPRKRLRPLTLAPATIDLVRRRRLSTTLLIVFGGGCLFTAPYALDQASEIAVGSYKRSIDACQAASDRSACLEQRTTAGLVDSGLGISLGVALFLLTGRKLMIAGSRRITWSLEDFSRTGLARPILFLRSFGEDRKAISPMKYWLPGRIVMFGQPRRTLDEMVLEETSALGPLIALADPANRAARFGAAPGNLGAHDWRQVVSELLDRAQIVIFFLERMDEAKGIRWELEQLAFRGDFEKYLFLVPPSYSAPEENRALIRQAFTILKSPSPAPEDGRPIAGFFFRAGSLCVGRSDQFTSASFLLMIRWFLRSRVSPAVG